MELWDKTRHVYANNIISFSVTAFQKSYI